MVKVNSASELGKRRIEPSRNKEPNNNFVPLMFVLRTPRENEVLHKQPGLAPLGQDLQPTPMNN